MQWAEQNSSSSSSIARRAGGQVDGHDRSAACRWRRRWLHNVKECKMCRKCAWKTFPKRIFYSQQRKSTSCTRATPKYPPTPCRLPRPVPRIATQTFSVCNNVGKKFDMPNAAGADGLRARITWNSRKQDPTQQAKSELEREREWKRVGEKPRGVGAVSLWEKVNYCSAC